MQAALIQLTLTGTVDSITAAGDDAAFQAILPFGTGATVTADYTNDSTTADSLGSNPSRGFYFGSGTVRYTIGSTVFQYSNATALTRNDDPDDRLFANLPSGPGTCAAIIDGPSSYAESVNVTRVFDAGLRLRDSTNSVVDSDMLPDTPFLFSDLTSATWAISDSAGTGGSATWTTSLGSHTAQNHYITGSFNSMSFAAVPEPSSFGVLLAGAVGNGCLVRRQRNRGRPSR